MNTIKDVITHLETIAPLSLQENYDNAGLITGEENEKVNGVLICLDSTEEVIEEAIINKCNLVIAHHPIIFSGLKKITGKTYVERVILKAIKNDIAIYACHTNLDNVLMGVNYKIAEKIGLSNLRVLAPIDHFLYKLVTFCPVRESEQVRNALFAAGAGAIGDYDNCSFNVKGNGTFRAGENSNPFVGERGKQHWEEEERIEMIFPKNLQAAVIKALLNSHPYEEVAYDIYSLVNKNMNVGAGVIGDLAEEELPKDFLKRLKKVMECQSIRHTKKLEKKIKKVAVCGGSGSFLLKEAIIQEADAFVTSDFKYHQFFDSEGRILVADIGHYESEQFTKDLFYELIMKKIPKFAVRLSKINTNPVNYL